jgi:hypothetical protein
MTNGNATPLLKSISDPQLEVGDQSVRIPKVNVQPHDRLAAIPAIPYSPVGEAGMAKLP